MGNVSSADKSARQSSPRLYDENYEHFVRRGHFFRLPTRQKTPAPSLRTGDLPSPYKKVCFASGCFWGSEKGFWRLPNVYSTSVGYIGGAIENPTYRHVCSGKTGHAECTLVIYNPAEISLADLLVQFWRCHDPTQGDRQGFDKGSQYRSGIYVDSEDDMAVASASKEAFGAALLAHGYSTITTEIRMGEPFWYAEAYHQCYLAKPGNRQYCSAEPTGVEVPNFVDWPLSSSRLLSQYAPKLPPAFWKTYDSSIRAPHVPAAWNGGPEAEALALAAAAEAAAKWEAEIKEAQRTSGVTIRFCGGCGFRHRATELSDYLLAATGVRVGLLEDPGEPTGNFDVSVRKNDGSGEFELVHSKKVPLRGLVQDGFVDSREKLERILLKMAEHGIASRVDVEKALNNSTELPRSLASPMGRGDSQKSAQALLDFWTDSRCPLVMFSKSWCKHCARAKDALRSQNIHPFVIEIDQRVDESDILVILGGRTGSDTVPSIWRRGKFMGGADEVVAQLAVNGGVFAGGDEFDRWAEDVGITEAWAWLDLLHTHPENALGAHFYRFMGDGHLRLPRSTDSTRSLRPPL